MPPYFSVNYIANGWSTDSKFLCQFNSQFNARAFSDFKHILFCEFMARIFLPLVLKVAILCNAVPHVVNLVSDKKMCRVAAAGIITRMKHSLIFRDIALLFNYPSQPVGKKFVNLSAYSYIVLAVTARKCGVSPWPTFGLLPPVDLPPEFFCVENKLQQEVARDTLRLHQSVHLIVCHALGPPRREGISTLREINDPAK